MSRRAIFVDDGSRSEDEWRAAVRAASEATGVQVLLAGRTKDPGAGLRIPHFGLN